MNDNDLKTICSKIESLHEKILKSKFAEKVTESEMLSLIFVVQELNRHKEEVARVYERLSATAPEPYINGRNDGIKEFAERVRDRMQDEAEQCEREMDELRARPCHARPVNYFEAYEELTCQRRTYREAELIIDNLVKEMVGEHHDES